MRISGPGLTLLISRKFPPPLQMLCVPQRISEPGLTLYLSYCTLQFSQSVFFRQYDVRTPHSCSGDVNNVLVYLRTHLGHFAEAKCLTVNPVRPEVLAAGANDPYVRLYDRRMIRLTKVNHFCY